MILDPSVVSVFWGKEPQREANMSRFVVEFGGDYALTVEGASFAEAASKAREVVGAGRGHRVVREEDFRWARGGVSPSADSEMVKIHVDSGKERVVALPGQEV